MSGLLFTVLDTETTGSDHAKDQVVEIGFAVTDLDGLCSRGSYLVKPTCPISPEASAVHHIVEDDVANASPLAEVLVQLEDEWAGCTPSVAYVAQNAPFDRGFLPTLNDKPWLDTLRMSRRYLPELTCHTNQALRYRLKLDVPRDTPAHRAEGDCVVTAALFRWMLNGPARDDFERLGVEGFAKHIDSPMVLHLCNFGKHAGKRWADVPRDYLQWILRQPDFDPDVQHTARWYYLGGVTGADAGAIPSGGTYPLLR